MSTLITHQSQDLKVQAWVKVTHDAANLDFDIDGSQCLWSYVRAH
jgi:hypothetical protein